eukprot:jgi/Galph1/814/GphlegSOOS_G5514.1
MKNQLTKSLPHNIVYELIQEHAIQEKIFEHLKQQLNQPETRGTDFHSFFYSFVELWLEYELALNDTKEILMFLVENDEQCISFTQSCLLLVVRNITRDAELVPLWANVILKYALGLKDWIIENVLKWLLDIWSKDIQISFCSALCSQLEKIFHKELAIDDAVLIGKLLHFCFVEIESISENLSNIQWLVNYIQYIATEQTMSKRSDVLCFISSLMSMEFLHLLSMKCHRDVYRLFGYFIVLIETHSEAERSLQSLMNDWIKTASLENIENLIFYLFQWMSERKEYTTRYDKPIYCLQQLLFAGFENPKSIESNFAIKLVQGLIGCVSDDGKFLREEWVFLISIHLCCSKEIPSELVSTFKQMQEMFLHALVKFFMSELQRLDMESSNNEKLFPVQSWLRAAVLCKSLIESNPVFSQEPWMSCIVQILKNWKSVEQKRAQIIYEQSHGVTDRLEWEEEELLCIQYAMDGPFTFLLQQDWNQIEDSLIYFVTDVASGALEDMCGLLLSEERVNPLYLSVANSASSLLLIAEEQKKCYKAETMQSSFFSFKLSEDSCILL